MRRRNTVTFKVNDEELKTLRESAEMLGISVGEFIRRCLFDPDRVMLDSLILKLRRWLIEETGKS